MSSIAPGAAPAAARSPGAEPRRGLIPVLELIRGLACLEVFLGHVTPQSAPRWIAMFTCWGTEAVMIFFVLSGLVIALTQERKHRPFASFMWARFRRLVPLYLIAVVLSCAVDQYLFPPVKPGAIWGHLLFLQAHATDPDPSPLTPVFDSNGPLWSLSFEFYFYLVFALLIGKANRPLTIMWWAAGLVAAVCVHFGYVAPKIAGHFQDILAASPVWLLGTTLLGRPLYFRACWFQNLILFSFIPVISHWSPTWASTDALKDFALGLVIAPLLYSSFHADQPVTRRVALLSWVGVALVYVIASAIMFHVARSFESMASILCYMAYPPALLALLLAGRALRIDISGWTFWQNPALALGRMSYAIYIIHLPILLLLGHFLPGHAFLLFLAGTAIVMTAAWIMEYFLQKKATDLLDRFV
jgi:peptidoglycan/LPS O-acetylase OafA/YrhL